MLHFGGIFLIPMGFFDGLQAKLSLLCLVACLCHISCNLQASRHKAFLSRLRAPHSFDQDMQEPIKRPYNLLGKPHISIYAFRHCTIHRHKPKSMQFRQPSPTISPPAWNTASTQMLYPSPLDYSQFQLADLPSVLMTCTMPLPSLAPPFPDLPVSSWSLQAQN